MQHTVFYLIEGRPELAERIAILNDPGLHELLFGPEMISNEEGGDRKSVV